MVANFFGKKAKPNRKSRFFGRSSLRGCVGLVVFVSPVTLNRTFAIHRTRRGVLRFPTPFKTTSWAFFWPRFWPRLLGHPVAGGTSVQPGASFPTRWWPSWQRTEMAGNPLAGQTTQKMPKSSATWFGEEADPLKTKANRQVFLATAISRKTRGGLIAREDSGRNLLRRPYEGGGERLRGQETFPHPSLRPRPGHPNKRGQKRGQKNAQEVF